MPNNNGTMPDSQPKISPMVRLKAMWEHLVSKYTIISWVIVSWIAITWIKNLWDTCAFVLGNVTGMVPLLKACTEYASSPFTQMAVMFFGLLWIGVAAYLGTGKKGVLTVLDVSFDHPPSDANITYGRKVRVILQNNHKRSLKAQRRVGYRLQTALQSKRP